MSHPIVSVDIAISPPSATLESPCLLGLYATLSYSGLITICTWPTVFNLSLTQRWKNSFCVDLFDDNTLVKLETTKGGRRSGHNSPKLGGMDDENFCTLLPRKLRKFTALLILATRPDKPLVAGHRYRSGMNEGERHHIGSRRSAKRSCHHLEKQPRPARICQGRTRARAAGRV